MKVYLFNDTSGGYSGSNATMRNLRAILAPNPIVAVCPCGVFEYDQARFADCDAVVVNGEGSIHHGNKKARFLMDVLRKAQGIGKRTYLVNATYQDMPPLYDGILRRLNHLGVREFSSWEYLADRGIQANLYVDLSVNRIFVGKDRSKGSRIFVGEAHPEAVDSVQRISAAQGEKLSLNDMDFQGIISYLHVNAKKYVTGQYHGVIAATLAGCDIDSFPSNTWKIDGLIRWADVKGMDLRELLLTGPKLRWIV